MRTTGSSGGGDRPRTWLTSALLVLFGAFVGHQIAPRGQLAAVVGTEALERDVRALRSALAASSSQRAAAPAACECAAKTHLTNPTGLHVLVPWRVGFFTPASAETATPELELPAGIRRVWMEVGVYQKSDLWDEMQKDANRDVAVIGFEPNVDYVRNHPKHDRLLLVPAAVSNISAYAVFNQWSPTGGSLYGLGPAHRTYLSEAEQKMRREKQRETAVMRLEHVLRVVPPAVTIEYLKVDAQGADYNVIVGAGSLLTRVTGVSAECQDISGRNDSRIFYSESCISSELKAYMTKLGFAHYVCDMQAENLREENCHFGKTTQDMERAKSLFRGL
jgi:hypothetical protein